jgi:(p)ppGpp synthase/HD superfamily hydrolase
MFHTPAHKAIKKPAGQTLGDEIARMQAADAPAFTLLEAYQLAERLHAGQVDKAGKPYIGHLVRVMLRVQAAGGDLDQQIAALLHDSIEDGQSNSIYLLMSGVPLGAVCLVENLTKNEGEQYLVYIGWIKQYPRAVLIKRADIADNSDPARLARLPEDQRQRLAKKYAEAMALLGPVNTVTVLP